MSEPRIASHEDDPSAPLADRLLLALGIWPEHARQLGDDEVVEAAVIIRTQAHRFPMCAEDYGAVRAELDEALTLLRRWLAVEPNPCRLDHNGDCQEHYVTPADDCPIALARVLAGGGDQEDTHG